MFINDISNHCLMLFVYREKERGNKKSLAAEVLSDAMPSHQYFGGMAANQTSFDGQQFHNQVAYAFKNCSSYTPQPSFQQMPQPFQQQMGMAPYMCGPQMYGGMAQMGMMNMGGAANYYSDDNDNKKKRKTTEAKKPVVDIDLSNDSQSNLSSEEE